MGIQHNDEVIHVYFRLQRFYFLVEQCLNIVKKSIGNLLRPYKINHSQYLILLMLSYADTSKNDVMATELSYILGLERHSISALLDKLDQRGYIQRTRSTKDRRVVHLKLTEAGRSLAEKIQTATIERIAVLSEEDLNNFEEVNDFLFSLSKAITTKNEINEVPYQEAYEKLLIKGQRVLSKNEKTSTEKAEEIYKS